MDKKIATIIAVGIFSLLAETIGMMVLFVILIALWGAL